MERGEIGGYEITSAGGERVRAFLPAPLPPDPPPVLDGALQQSFESAALALGRLDNISAFLPDSTLFLYAYVRKEAVLSSQIEGTQSSFSDLLLYESQGRSGVPLDDVVEVSNHVAALEHGLSRLREGFPMSNRLIREIHGVLLRKGRGSNKAPGEFRRSQNWIGGTRPGNAVFVPPPYTAVQDCMSDLERFLNAEDDGLPVLIRAGLAHVQFETIHPFLDGNGRVGRLLIVLLLCRSGVLREPLLYLSLYFKRRQSTYYDLLDHVRRTGDWEAWLAFFLESVRVGAEDAVATSRRLSEMFVKDREAIERRGRRTGSALLVHQALTERPILSISEICKRRALSFPAVSSAMDRLIDYGIVREVTGRHYGRLFAYGRYLAILNEGTELDAAPERESEGLAGESPGGETVEVNDERT